MSSAGGGKSMCEVARRVFAKLSVAGILDTGHRALVAEQSKDPPHTLDTNKDKDVCYILLDMSIDDGKSMCSMLWLVCRQQ